jgi:uncharacterized protein (TIGR04255 family)
MNRLPVRLDLSPIVEAILEIRYKSDFPADAVFGVIYSKIRPLFGTPIKLPILEFPETIRSKDPNLKYQPHFELPSGDNIRLGVGPRSLIFRNNKPYIGWTKWSQFIQNVISQLRELNVIANVERLGIRVINFFDQNILNRINLSIIINDQRLINEVATLRAEFREGQILKILQIANSAELIINRSKKSGSVIDIDCLRTFDPNERFFDIYETVAAEAHAKGKELFFGLLTPELLSELKPTYEE